MGDATDIPDRRRKHFPLNGGPRPTEPERSRGREGLSGARAALAAAIPAAPSGQTVIRRLTPEQIVRARQGIAAARNELDPVDDDPNEASTTAA